MSPTPVPGTTIRERAIALAGVLAEAGVADLALASPEGWVRLTPRQTDLPALLAAAAERPEAELLALDRPIRVALTPSSFLAFTTDPGFADALTRAAAKDTPHA